MNSDDDIDIHLATVIAAGIDTGITIVLRKLFWGVVFVFIITFILSYIFDLLMIGYDSTDGSERSGMKAMTDNLTGCQYLSAGGSLTPRLDVDGIQIGCK